MKYVRKLMKGIAILCLAGTLSSCFGEYALIRKVYTWNSEIMDKDTLLGRFVNQLVFYALSIVPVYGVAGLVDVMILNLIEFWTGTNPLAMAEGDFEEQRIMKDGNEYLITASKNQFHIQDLCNEHNQITLKFNEDDLAWDASTPFRDFRLVEMTKDGSLAMAFDPFGNSLALK